MKQVILSNIMSKDIDRVSSDAPFNAAIRLMSERKRSCLVVTNAERVPTGIITESHALSLMSHAEDMISLLNKPCTDVQGEMVISNQATPLEDALRLLEIKKSKHLVVVDDENHLSGVVTQSDLVKSYSHMITTSREHLERRVLERTQELEVANRKLATMSLVDPLTGLGNRRAMQVDIMKTHASSIRHKHAYTVALLDIDHFKKYNDHYGHQQGDDALKQVGAHLNNSIRETDSLYRYGGEEFLILMPETNSEEAMIPLKRIIDNLVKLAIPHEKSPFEKLTLSAGAACSNHKLTGWREIIELADRRLYEAKSRGRNQFCVKDGSGLTVVKAG